MQYLVEKDQPYKGYVTATVEADGTVVPGLGNRKGQRQSRGGARGGARSHSAEYIEQGDSAQLQGKHFIHPDGKEARDGMIARARSRAAR